MHLLIIMIIVFFSGCVPLAAGAEDHDSAQSLPDKSGYNLFNPVPRNLMRELTPDRPDKTESPYTVDAGHFQLEISFAEYLQGRNNGVRTKNWNIAPLNLTVGLLNNMDLQFIFNDYFHTRTEDLSTGTTTTQSGFGDSTVRLKMNLWGNDGGETAFGVMPFIKLPTNTDNLGNNSIEGGIIFPFAVKLPADWEMGIETAPALMRNQDNHGYHLEFINTIVLGHKIMGKLGGYAEFFSNVSTESGSAWAGTVDLGLTYDLTRDIQFDCGVNIGVTRAADAVNPFVGMTVRF